MQPHGCAALDRGVGSALAACNRRRLSAGIAARFSPPPPRAQLFGRAGVARTHSTPGLRLPGRFGHRPEARRFDSAHSRPVAITDRKAGISFSQVHTNPRRGRANLAQRGNAKCGSAAVSRSRRRGLVAGLDSSWKWRRREMLASFEFQVIGGASARRKNVDCVGNRTCRVRALARFDYSIFAAICPPSSTRWAERAGRTPGRLLVAGGQRQRPWAPCGSTGHADGFNFRLDRFAGLEAERTSLRGLSGRKRGSGAMGYRSTEGERGSCRCDGGSAIAIDIACVEPSLVAAWLCLGRLQAAPRPARYDRGGARPPSQVATATRSSARSSHKRLRACA